MENWLEVKKKKKATTTKQSFFLLALCSRLPPLWQLVLVFKIKTGTGGKKPMTKHHRSLGLKDLEGFPTGLHVNRTQQKQNYLEDLSTLQAHVRHFPYRALTLLPNSTKHHKTENHSEKSKQ